jgi:hypothetical protein
LPARTFRTHRKCRGKCFHCPGKRCATDAARWRGIRGRWRMRLSANSWCPMPPGAAARRHVLHPRIPLARSGARCSRPAGGGSRRHDAVGVRVSDPAVRRGSLDEVVSSSPHRESSLCCRASVVEHHGKRWEVDEFREETPGWSWRRSSSPARMSLLTCHPGLERRSLRIRDTSMQISSDIPSDGGILGEDF